MLPSDSRRAADGCNHQLAGDELSSPDVVDRRQFVKAGAAFSASALWLRQTVWAQSTNPPRRHARGRVFHDADRTGRPGPKNPCLAGVLVSNGCEITQSDECGEWSLPVDDETVEFFVIKPRGWQVPLNENRLPQFTYLHRPEGSPTLKYPGIPPTGPLPESIDFGFRPQDEADQFTALFCGDPQPRDTREVDYLANTLVPQLRGTDAAFGISLGDIMFDDLSLYPLLNSAFGKIGVPWLNVFGNHDLNYDAADNQFAFETFRHAYGATYYSFDWGPVHFLVLNNIEWTGRDSERPESSGRYRGFLGERQLAFIANDLKFVPRDRLVVLAMHIPLTGTLNPNPAIETVDRQALLQLLSDFPHTLSFSAHMHWQGHVFVGKESGWTGATPHHHIITGTLCGSWFGGSPGVDGVPHATMSDGTPRGFLEVRFNGNQYAIDGYRGVQQQAARQMNIIAPSEIGSANLSSAMVYVNVFNGSEKSRVRFRVDASDEWNEMTHSLEPDPSYLALYERDQHLELPYRKLPQPSFCYHLWRHPLPADLQVGTHLIEVVETDMFGNEHQGTALIRVTG